MTSGAAPRYSDDPYAQWIKKRLKDKGWQKKDLAESLEKKSRGRLAMAGATRLVIRATHGENINEENQALIASVLGAPPIRPPDAADQSRQDRIEKRLQAVERRLADLETG